MLILYVFVYPHVLVCVFKYDIHKEHALHSYTNEILHHSLLIGITKDAIWWGHGVRSPAVFQTWET